MFTLPLRLIMVLLLTLATAAALPRPRPGAAAAGHARPGGLALRAPGSRTAAVTSPARAPGLRRPRAPATAPAAADPHGAAGDPLPALSAPRAPDVPTPERWGAVPPPRSTEGGLLRAPPGAGDSAWRPPLDRPLQVLRRFAPPSRPWLAGHRGVDLAARRGDVVRAAGSGVVGYAGPLAGRGVVMIVHPGGLRTTYLPVEASVRRGQVVGRGEALGLVDGASAHCPAPCLHWGLISEKGYLDALSLIGLGQVRLLPRWPSAQGAGRPPR